MIPERDRIQTVMTPEEIAEALESGDYSAEMLMQHLIRHHNRLERELAESAQSFAFQTQLNREVIELEKKTLGERNDARAEIDQIKAILADPIAVHINMIRGTIKWTPANLRHLLGDTGDAMAIIDATLKALPVGYIPAHTPESLPGRVADLVSELARLKATLEDPAEVELAMIRGDIAIPHRVEFDGIRDTPSGDNL